MTDHAEHFAEQQVIWTLIREEFEAQHRRDPRFCVRCAMDGLFIANLVGLTYGLQHAETNEERHEYEVAIAQQQMLRAGQNVEHPS